MLVLDLLLGKNVVVVSVPHEENKEAVEGLLDFFQRLVDVCLFVIQKSSEIAQGNVPF
jgi:hypothetical protein